MSRSPDERFISETARMMPVLLREINRQQKEFFPPDLAISHIVLLDHLNANGPSKMTDLAEELGTTMSAVTSIVDKMIQSRLVERRRSDEDRRVVRVSLRDEGVKMVLRVNKERRRMAEQMFSVLEKAEKKEYLRLLSKVCDGLTSERNEKQ